MRNALPNPEFAQETAVLPHDLLVDELLQLFFAKVVLVLVEVEELLRNRGCGRLVLGVVVRFEVRVFQGFLHRDALHRVEGQQLLEQVERQVRSLGEESSEWDLLLERKRADVLASAARLNPIVVLHGRGTKNVQDQG